MDKMINFLNLLSSRYVWMNISYEISINIYKQLPKFDRVQVFPVKNEGLGNTNTFK